MNDVNENPLDKYLTEAIEKRNYDLTVSIENTVECQGVNKLINEYLEDIKKHLPQNKKDLLPKLEDCFTTILIIYQRQCYYTGFCDAVRFGELSKKPSEFIHT